MSRLFVATWCFIAFSLGMACSGGGDGSGDDTDTVTYTATSDTLSRLLGMVNGYQFRTEINNFCELEDTTYNIKDFADGLSAVLDRRHAMPYIMGLSTGIKMSVDADAMADRGAKIDRKKIYDLISHSIDTTDSILPSRVIELSETYRQLTDRISPDASAAFNDSLQNAYAAFVGASISAEIQDFEATENRKFNTDRFMDGVEKMFTTRHQREYVYGAYQAIQLAQQMAVMEKKGVNIRPQTVLDNIKTALFARDIDSVAYRAAAIDLRDLVQRIDRADFEAEDQRLADSDKAIQNIKTGEALVNKMKQEHPEAKTTASGLTYIIHLEPKYIESIADSDTVLVNYTLSHLDNKVFDTDRNAKLTVNNLMPGMKEGVMMLGKGAKASFWIPGNLAYGGHGVPGAQVGPMETIICDIEIVDVLPSDK